jgi:hypothetical protein
MKILTIILIVLCIVFMGCESDRKSAEIEYYERGLKVATVDSCEYVVLSCEAIVHKQNCKYCAARAKESYYHGQPVTYYDSIKAWRNGIVTGDVTSKERLFVSASSMADTSFVITNQK